MPIQIAAKAVIVVDVSFKNNSAWTLPNTHWRIGVGRGNEVFPILTNWIETGPVLSGATALVSCQAPPLPGDWGQGELIEIALDVEVDNNGWHEEGGSKKYRLWDDYFEVQVPSISWITILTAKPTVL